MINTKKYALLSKWALVGLCLSIGLATGCAPKKIDPDKALLGTFKSDKAQLEVKSIERDTMGASMDFQFEYQNPQQTGTLFGQAESVGEYAFKYDLESLGVEHHLEFEFVEKHWVIKHQIKDPQKKPRFNYSGVYQKG